MPEKHAFCSLKVSFRLNMWTHVKTAGHILAFAANCGKYILQAAAKKTKLSGPAL